MSRVTLAARVRRDRTKYLIGNVTHRKKTFLNLAMLCVLHFGRTFSILNRFSKFLLHILGQTKRQIVQTNISPTLHLLPTFQTSSSLLRLHSPICVGSGRKPRLFEKVDKYKLFKERKRICVHTKILEYWRVRFLFLYLYPRKLCLWAGILFSYCPLFLLKTQFVGTR